MKTSYQQYEKELELKRQEMQKKRERLNVTKDLCSKIKTNNLIKIREKKLRLIHKRRLEKMAKDKESKIRKLN